MKYWETKDGTEIRIKDMETSHIENCIRMLQRKFKDGKAIVIEQGGSMGADNMDIDFWEEEVDRTKEYKDWIKTFKKELKRRK